MRMRALLFGCFLTSLPLQAEMPMDFGLYYGSPLRLSLELGGHRSFGEFSPRLAIEPGLGGIKAILGYGFHDRSTYFFSTETHLSFNGIFLRTYGNPISIEKNANYLGLETRLAINGLALKLGATWSLDSKKAHFMWAVGIGL